MTPDRLLDGLNHAQVQAVTAPSGRVVVLAGAGSGKTRVLTRRIAWRIANGETDPNRVLALTFTRKAAAELRSRQRELGLRDLVPAGTFHSFALNQLRQRWAERRTIPPTLVDNKIRMMARLCRLPANVELLDVVGEVDWARARMVEPEDYGTEAHQAGRTPPVAPEFITELMVGYQKEKRRKRVVDFDDLLTLAVRDLRADPDYAAAIRWRHRHFYVDEFQDVNPLQYQLLTEWLGDRDDLFLVGDPRQSIYSWNGAEPSLLNELARADGSSTIELADNYRSTPQVLCLAEAVLIAGSHGNTAPPPSTQLGPLVGHKPDGPAPVLTAYDSDRAEAVGVAEAARLANASGYRYSQQAVLVRTNAQLVLIEQELSAMGIPSQVRTGPGPLGSPEVKAALKEIARQGIDLVQQLEDLDTQLNTPLDEATATSLERHNNMAALSRLIHDYVTLDPTPTGPGLLAWLGTLTGGDVDRDTESVDLATFHGAKGLEWPVVHITGLEDGFVPIVYATTRAQLAEESRLLYVALTRAQDQLFLSWAKQRTFGTKSASRQPATVLSDLTAAMAKAGGSAIAPDWRAHIKRSRRAIGDLTGGISQPSAAGVAAPGDRASTDETYESLRAWRARKARANGVPPHVIVTDQVLRAVAQHQPKSITQLAAVTELRPAKLNRFGEEILAVTAEPQ